MPHRNPLPHRSDPETDFDHWLDGFVMGTPAGETSRDETVGSLGRAMAGARQLHGLAAGQAVSAAARQRIEEDLMQRGSLAAPGGTTWIPMHEEKRRAPLWSKVSPVLATAAVVAVIVALVASLVWTQRPVSSPGGSDAPGFAAASPAASSAAGGSDLLIVRGLPADKSRALSDRVGVLDDDGLTILQPDADPIELPGVNEIVPIGVPGQAMVTWLDSSRAVIDVTTGETVFDLPDVSERESFAIPYLFVSESGENADWMIYDLRTGESRPLSEIVELPDDQLAIPVPSGFAWAGPGQTDAIFHFVSPDHEVSPTSEIPRFFIAGSLERAGTLDGFPPATQAVGHFPVFSLDHTKVAWIAIQPDNEIVVTDTGSGEVLARVALGQLSPAAQLAGFIKDGSRLVITTYDRIIWLGWDEEEPELQTIDEGLDGVGNPLFHAASGSLYFTVSDAMMRMLIPESGATTIVPDVSAASPAMFTSNDAQWIVAEQGRNAALIDARTGEIVSQLNDVPPNEAEFNAVSTSTSLDGSTFMQTIGGTDSGYLVSPRYPDGLVLTAPIDPEVIAASIAPNGIPVYYNLSPDGSRVVAGTVDMDAGYVPRYIAPVEPDPKWTPIAQSVTNLYWIPMPDSDQGENVAETLPAMDFSTPEPLPDNEVRVTSFEIAAKDDIFVSVVVDGIPVFEGELAEGESTGWIEGSAFEVYTTSGANTQFTNACGQPFNMGYEPGEAVYILEANENTCPASPSAAETPAQ